MPRTAWTSLGDPELLRQCAVDTYRASGPGGQKRNKTSSAVRLRHLPSGLIVIAEESRSQHENREKALRRLRQALYLELREPVPPECLDRVALGERCEAFQSATEHEGQLSLGRKDPRFWPVVGVVLDVLEAVQARVAPAAEALGTSTGKLIDFLETEPKVWQQVNTLRVRFGHKPLHTG